MTLRRGLLSISFILGVFLLVQLIHGGLTYSRHQSVRGETLRLEKNFAQDTLASTCPKGRNRTLQSCLRDYLQESTLNRELLNGESAERILRLATRLRLQDLSQGVCSPIECAIEAAQLNINLIENLLAQPIGTPAFLFNHLDRAWRANALMGIASSTVRLLRQAQSEDHPSTTPELNEQATQLLSQLRTLRPTILKQSKTSATTRHLALILSSR